MASRGERGPGIRREEVEAAIAARKELGPDLEPELIESFLARIEGQMQERQESRVTKPRGSRPDDDKVLALAIVSVCAGVLLALAAMWSGPETAWVAIPSWLALIWLNWTYSRRR
jgi:hypothetical protein